MTNSNQLVGFTRSLRHILQPVDISDEMLSQLTENYTQADHFDAYSAFQFLISSELSSIGRDSPRLDVYEEIGRFHIDRLGEQQIKIQMKILSLDSIFDVVKYGKSRAYSILP